MSESNSEHQRYRKAAIRLRHRDGDIEIAHDAEVSVSADSGAYVQAWVWVPDAAVQLDDDSLTKDVVKDRNDSDKPTPLLDTFVYDWRLAERVGLSEIPAAEANPYRITLESLTAGQQFILAVSDLSDPSFAAEILIEVNRGVPCLHVSNESNGDKTCHIFFTQKGVTVVSDDPIQKEVPDPFYPNSSGSAVFYENPISKSTVQWAENLPSVPAGVLRYHDYPSVPGLYLGLFNGRRDPKERPDGLGFPGPLIGPLKHARSTGDDRIELVFQNELDAMKYGLAPHCPQIPIVERLAVYVGAYYRNWVVGYYGLNETAS